MTASAWPAFSPTSAGAVRSKPMMQMETMFSFSA